MISCSTGVAKSFKLYSGSKFVLAGSFLWSGNLPTLI